MTSMKERKLVPRAALPGQGCRSRALARSRRSNFWLRRRSRHDCASRENKYSNSCARAACRTSASAASTESPKRIWPVSSRRAARARVPVSVFDLEGCLPKSWCRGHFLDLRTGSASVLARPVVNTVMRYHGPVTLPVLSRTFSAARSALLVLAKLSPEAATLSLDRQARQRYF